jgi:predicted ATPase
MDGVVWVPLADCDSGEQLLLAVAAALGCSFGPELDSRPILERFLAQLCDYLRSRCVLLVLDNLEHLVCHAALLSSLLAAAPGIRLLVTSRERLGVPEEWVLEVRGLPYPASQDPGRDTASPAVQLFRNCAQRARASSVDQDADGPAMARICQLVGGAPLGIELAAAWVGVMSVQEVALEVERGTDLLVSRQRHPPARHVSLRAVFEHSWTLLSAAEQNAFAGLAAFRGGFTLQAAAQVARASRDMLSALFDKSLLQRDERGRCSIHQVLQRFAAEELWRTVPLRVQTCERHCRYYLDLLETAEDRLMGSEQQEALQTLRVEDGNLHCALETATADADWGRLRQVLPLWVLSLEMRSARGEVAETVQPILKAARAACARERDNVALNTVLALALAAQHFAQVGSPPAPEALAEGLAIARALPDSLEKGFALLLDSSSSLLPPTEAQEVSLESLAIFQAYSHPWGLAMARLVWADAANYGSSAHDAAEPVYETARETFEDLGNRWGQALCLTGLADVAFHRQEHGRAMSLAEGGLAIYRDLGDPGRASFLRWCLARYATASGDYGVADRYYREELALARALGRRVTEARLLSELAQIAELRGDPATASAYREQSGDLGRQLGGTRHADAFWLYRVFPG